MKHIQTLSYLKSFHSDLLASECADLTHRQVLILLTIYLDRSARTVRALARQLAISKPAISRTLDKLEGLGLVERAEDETDMRSITIQPTQNGGRFLTRYSSIAVSNMRRAFTEQPFP